MFFPWTETKSLVYFDDSACGLSAAHNLLKSKDIDRAVQKAESNLEECRGDPHINPKVLAHAYYDAGILQFIKSDYSRSLEDLSEANKLDSNKVILEALGEVRNAQESSTALARYTGDVASATKASNSGGHLESSAGPPPPNKDAGMSAAERLRRLDDLLRKKLITRAEYDQKRAEILSAL
jgi:hypothetical protein